MVVSPTCGSKAKPQTTIASAQSRHSRAACAHEVLARPCRIPGRSRSRRAACGPLPRSRPRPRHSRRPARGGRWRTSAARSSWCSAPRPCQIVEHNGDEIVAGRLRYAGAVPRRRRRSPGFSRQRFDQRCVFLVRQRQHAVRREAFHRERAGDADRVALRVGPVVQESVSALRAIEASISCWPFAARLPEGGEQIGVCVQVQVWAYTSALKD